ncbi:triokinase/FMN cyclase-like isoform X2 [Phymastichus coffea]|uniref:triokinase/FMN cyclase-like isoform X2 n=1 Tax=Phymastichus coffea TaxID=108790 RepID=UPI00273C9B60|nr:triokinase/FMN cyclase-like isoform X2 [Phymastichus coffea]
MYFNKQHCCFSAGCLVVIPNYTGDCLNFGLAIERARNSGLKVAQVIVGEDCSVPDNELGRAGKRALPGIMLVLKVAGALAEKGYSLENVTKYAQLVADDTASCSIGLTACTIPGRGRMFELADDEINFGQGLHGEAGYKRIKLQSASKIVAIMIDTIRKALKLQKEDSVVVLVNNFGGLSQLEQGVVVKEVVTQLQNMDILPLRVYCGLLMTSLDSAGMHVSILKLPEKDKVLLLDALDQQTEAPRWPGCSYSLPSNYYKVPIKEERPHKQTHGPTLTESQKVLLKNCLQEACEAIIAKEKVINELDLGCGDGDCGTTLKHLAVGAMSAIDQLSLFQPSSLLSELANIAEDRMGGTSGAIYSLMFTTAAAEMSKNEKVDNWIKVWSVTWRAGINGITKYSKARLGDKTMIDVLNPSLDELDKHLSLTYKEAAKIVAAKANECSKATKHMIPRAGRASYVKQEQYLKGMDAGAFAVATWINAIAEAL